MNISKRDVMQVVTWLAVVLIVVAMVTDKVKVNGTSIGAVVFLTLSAFFQWVDEATERHRERKEREANKKG